MAAVGIYVKTFFTFFYSDHVFTFLTFLFLFERFYTSMAVDVPGAIKPGRASDRSGHQLTF